MGIRWACQEKSPDLLRRSLGDTGQLRRLLRFAVVAQDPNTNRDFNSLVERSNRWLKSHQTIASSMPTLTFKPHSAKIQYFTEDLGKKLLGKHTSLDMVFIPGGRFTMGSPEGELERLEREGPQHLVTVPEFFMGQTPVTQAQWRQVAGWPQVGRSLKANPSNFKGDDLPVEQVSWFAAEEFCLRLSKSTGRRYRLPSEAEWEYACRAGTNTPFHFGETIDAEYANYQAVDEKFGETVYPGIYGSGRFGNYRQKTTPVKEFPPNKFGLYDMHGNVWEWCEDHWHGDYKSAPIDGKSWVDKTAETKASRVLRGGSWLFAPRFCRSASRIKLSPADAYSSFGFRVVCVSPRTQP
ncbi:MAG: SUMF1/EgtB/PvdO family nonheme iron enzyme [Alkalinema sp. RU_4_3]|nr:SUMF1/EgtB/PvdO family nonheme iron enzyme [Alkalinema sp. RU_4_3]